MKDQSTNERDYISKAETAAKELLASFCCLSQSCALKGLENLHTFLATKETLEKITAKTSHGTCLVLL